ncbi:MAG: hypothetical protein HYR62_08265 [Actinobacteria bacterium]|nr:hypothetical protein [Actinomycetota bacterium]MBI3686259.1 hypothetical protein [Actinomycetota bacterium]
MAGEFHVPLASLSGLADQLAALARRAAGTRDQAMVAEVRPDEWGLLGYACGLPMSYHALADAIHRELDLSVSFLDGAAQRLAVTVDSYRRADQASVGRTDILERRIGGSAQ